MKKNTIRSNTIITCCFLTGLGLGCVSRSAPNTVVVDSTKNNTFGFFVAAVGPENPRNSEAAIVLLRDSSLLLGWTEFYAGDGEDHGPARNPLTAAISKNEGETWENFRNIEDAPDDLWAYPAVTLGR